MNFHVGTAFAYISPWSVMVTTIAKTVLTKQPIVVGYIKVIGNTK